MKCFAVYIEIARVIIIIFFFDIVNMKSLFCVNILNILFLFGINENKQVTVLKSGIIAYRLKPGKSRICEIVILRNIYLQTL